MFGRKPCLPIDILFSTNTAKLKDNTSTKCLENLKCRLEWGHKTANEVARKSRNETNDTMIRKLDVQN